MKACLMLGDRKEAADKGQKERVDYSRLGLSGEPRHSAGKDMGTRKCLGETPMSPQRNLLLLVAWVDKQYGAAFRLTEALPWAGHPGHSPPPAAIISCVQMARASLIWDNQVVGAQLGPGPLCQAVMGQPQLERPCRPGPGAL